MAKEKKGAAIPNLHTDVLNWGGWTSPKASRELAEPDGMEVRILHPSKLSRKQDHETDAKGVLYSRASQCNRYVSSASTVLDAGATVQNQANVVSAFTREFCPHPTGHPRYPEILRDREDPNTCS